MMNYRDVQKHIEKIAMAGKRFKCFRPKDLDRFEVEETNNGICIDWRFSDWRGGAFEISYGPGNTYIKTELRTFGNGPELTFTRTYDPNHPLDIDTCVELVFEAMKQQLSNINNHTQILNLIYANKNYQHFIQ